MLAGYFSILRKITVALYANSLKSTQKHGPD
jgi:hypothetical protein